MPIPGPLHWHEGLFLQPHHLQTMQRHLLDQFALERKLAWPFPYGLVESRVAADAMENLLVRFDRLRVVMPSGLEVNFPDNADLPTLDIRRPFEGSSQSFVVSLGVPLWESQRANAIDLGGADDWRVKRLFRVQEIERADENTGENPQPVLVRKVNARLMLEGDDTTDLEVVPLMRIAHASGPEVGLPRQDPNFIPPSLVLGGSPTLRELCRDLANQVEASRKELVIQISRGGFSIDTMRGVQFEQMLRLRSLNRFSARLPNLVIAAATTPFQMYVELAELLGELSALHPERDAFETAPYDHENPAPAFRELSDKIRALLRGTVAAKFLKVVFTPDGPNLVAALSDEHLNVPNAYFLGVKTKDDPTIVQRLVQNADQFKLMAKTLAANRAFGIKLADERNPPLELPSMAGLNYFRLSIAESQRMWDRIKMEKEMALRWPDMQTSDFQVTLYMTVPG